MQLLKGSYYHIVCRSGDQALKMEESDPSKHSESRIIANLPNKDDNTQIWMVEKVGAGDDEYQIVNCLSTYVCSVEDKQIRLTYGKQSKGQLFRVQHAPVVAYYKYYWIKSSKGDEAITLEGILRFAEFDPYSQLQLFRFDRVSNKDIQQSKLIDVPKATRQKGERIIQWQRNNRWNQRWRLIKSGNGIIIESFYNGLVLDISQQKKQNGNKIIQWNKTGHLNQIWIVEETQQGVFKLKSELDQSLCLAVKNGDVDDGGLLEISNHENPSMYWKFQGAQP